MRLQEAVRKLHESSWSQGDHPQVYLSMTKKWGNPPIKAVDSDWIQKSLPKNPSSFNRQLSVLSSVLRSVGVTPPKVKRRLVEESDRRGLTPDELSRVSSWYEGQSVRDNALFLFLRDTGARPGEEVRRYRPGDFDGVHVRLVTRKGGSGEVSRSVPATPAVKQAIAWMVELGERRLDWSISPSWNKMRSELFPGRSSVVPYVLRHTYAMRLLKAGVPLHVVSRMLGHRSMTTTLAYTRYTHEDTASVLAAL